MRLVTSPTFVFDSFAFLAEIKACGVKLKEPVRDGAFEGILRLSFLIAMPWVLLPDSIGDLGDLSLLILEPAEG